MEIDIEKLRDDLRDYFLSATFYNQYAYADVIEIENAHPFKLIKIATENGFNLNDYVVNKRR